MINPNGTFKIIDRKKNLFKLSQGEYVSPEKVENIYIEYPYLAEAFVHGTSLKDFCVGIFVVDPVFFEAFVKEAGLGKD